jgi:Ca2+-binding RTX toxin-like protein
MFVPSPQRLAKYRRALLPALTSALALAVLFSPAAKGASTYQVPTTITSDCSVDVTRSLLTWIASVPNNSTLAFGASGCYRIEGTLELRGRSGLTFEGNGATFRSLNPPADQRAIWRVIDSTGLVLRDMTVDGSYAFGGTFNYDLQHAHAIDLRGTSAEIANVTMSSVAGDCVYFGLGYTSALTRSSGSAHDSTCLRTGRNAVSVTAGNDIRVERVTTDKIGLTAFDVEPNAGPGWGAERVTFDSNTIRSYYLYAYSVVGDAPISAQTFSNNRLVGKGLRLAVLYPTYRPQGVAISGNSSDTAVAWPMEFHGVDDLTVTNNVVPTSDTPMAVADTSCGVDISGNSYPGGSSQAQIAPWACALAPTSGPVGTSVTLSGSGFTGATSVKFNGTAATFSVDGNAQISTTVPSGATSGTIKVTTPAGTATSSTSFTVTGVTTTAGSAYAATINGTSRAETIYGTPQHDLVRARGGNDTVYLRGNSKPEVGLGGDGADRIFGQAGRDFIKGGRGGDKLYGGRGSDNLYGGPGADILILGPGESAAFANSGRDVIKTRNGVADVIDCGDGFDIAYVDRVDVEEPPLWASPLGCERIRVR